MSQQLGRIEMSSLTKISIDVIRLSAVSSEANMPYFFLLISTTTMAMTAMTAIAMPT